MLVLPTFWLNLLSENYRKALHHSVGRSFDPLIESLLFFIAAFSQQYYSQKRHKSKIKAVPFAKRGERCASTSLKID